MSMMLKALGIDLDPNMIKEVAGAVTGIHARLKTIEDQNAEILAYIRKVDNAGSTSASSSSEPSSGDGSSGSIVSSGNDSREDSGSSGNSAA
jgi:hypothetical protein